jgi:tetratricopeptide (TPR) repeat protein
MIHLVLAVAIVAGAQSPTPPPANTQAQAWYEFLLARHLESEGDADGAIAAYKRAAALDPDAAEIYTSMAELYARQNKVDECIAAGEDALKRSPDNIGAHRILGLVYASLAQSRSRRGSSRDYAADALQHLEKVQNAPRPPEGSVLLAIGRLQVRSGNYEKAIAVLRQLVEQEPQFTDGVELLAQAYTGAGREAEATALLEDLAKDDPDYLAALAEQYERANDWSKAAATYERAAQHDPADNDLRSRWVIALLNSEEPADAAKATAMLEKAVAAKPDDTQSLYMLSQAQRRAKNFTGAEASARQIIKNDPNGFAGPYALAQVFEDQRNYTKVVEVLSPIVSTYTARTDTNVRGDVARLFLHLGYAYQQLEDYPHAVETLEQGKRFARDTSMLFQLASVFEHQKRYADAERTFKEVLQKDPVNAPALNYLGYMLAERGERLDEAVGYIKRALDAEPDNASYLDSLGWAYMKMNRTDLAEDLLRRASADLTTNSVVQDHWGDLLFKLGRYNEAIAAWQRALAGDGESIDRAKIDKKIKSARDKK